MATASKLGSGVPKPANQGTSGTSPVQPANVQVKRGPNANLHTSKILYSVQPSGTGGTGTNAGVPGLGTK